jgi:hypothetical protein
VNPASEKARESRVEKILISAVGNVVATAVKTGVHLHG